MDDTKANTPEQLKQTVYRQGMELHMLGMDIEQERIKALEYTEQHGMLAPETLEQVEIYTGLVLKYGELLNEHIDTIERVAVLREQGQGA